MAAAKSLSKGQKGHRLSPELVRLLARSRLINRNYGEEFDISFSSLLLALLVSDGSMARWFQAYVKGRGIDIQRILKERDLNQKILDEAAVAPLQINAMQACHQLTTSAQEYLRTADKFRESLSEGDPRYPLDVHHMVAVFIYKPWIHQEELERWGFDRADWSKAFIKEMGSMYPDEVDFWVEQHRQAFGVEPEDAE